MELTKQLNLLVCVLAGTVGKSYLTMPWLVHIRVKSEATLGDVY